MNVEFQIIAAIMVSKISHIFGKQDLTLFLQPLPDRVLETVRLIKLDSFVAKSLKLDIMTNFSIKHFESKGK